MGATKATKTWTQVRAALDTTMERMGSPSPRYTVTSPYEGASAVEKRKAGRIPQTEEQRTVTVTFDLNAVLWAGHTEARHLCITAKKRETALDNLDAIQRAFETIRLTALRNLDGIVFRIYRQMFPEYQQQMPPPPPPRQEHTQRTTSTGSYATLHIADNAPLAVAEAAYRALVKNVHPDVGGSHELMVALNAAIHTIRLKHKATA